MAEWPRSLLEGIYHYEKVKADTPWLTQLLHPAPNDLMPADHAAR